MLDANTSAIRKGTGLMSSRSHTSSVTGAISSTVVTLSQEAPMPNAVIRTSRIMTRSGGTIRAFRCPDRDVLEDTGLAEHADDDHHAQQQKDDVPVDSGLMGVEDVGGADNPENHHDARTAECDRAC